MVNSQVWLHGPIPASRDLHLDLRDAITPGARGARELLLTALRDAVRSGRLAAGTMLPPSRSLATDLGLARNTVAEAYAELVAEGWLASRQGAGTWVVNTSGAQRPARPRGVRVVPTHNLLPGNPDVAEFPRNEWAAATRRALTNAPTEALRMGDPRGRPELARRARRLPGARARRADVAGLDRHLRGRAPCGGVAGPRLRTRRPDRGRGIRALRLPRRTRRHGNRHRPNRTRRPRRGGRRTRRARRACGVAHPRTSQSVRDAAASVPANRGRRVGPTDRRLRDGRRLRRRVPLRPPTDRRAPGTESRTGRLSGFRQ